MSHYVSSDGLVAWKSTKLGANFYTPNIFAKNIKDLTSKLLDKNGTCKYPLDILVISGISIDILQDNCKSLSKFVNESTTVLISADFGCELEKIALKSLGDRCRCVMSIACDVECRQLSLGSYALVNDDNCEIYLGNTYSLSNGPEDSIFSRNIAKVQEELNDSSTCSITRMVRQLEATQWIRVQRFKETKQMALKIWQLIIPKISLNILSIIYEQFDYEKMLENKSTEVIFKGLVQELLDICLAQCDSKVDKFLKESSETDKTEIDFTAIIEHCKKKRNELITTTANEYPEYLFLPFELYCFYHRFEYPAQVLLYQPILLAEEYNVPCSNLNFLFGFYSRLLSLSGLSINGGRLQQDISQLGQHVDGSHDHSNLKRCKCKSRVKLKDATLKSKLGARLVTSKNQQGRGIFSIASPAGADYTMPPIFGQPSASGNGPTSNNPTNSESNFPSDEDDVDFCQSDCERESALDVKEARCHCEMFDPMGSSKTSQACRSHDSISNEHFSSTDSFNHANRTGSRVQLDDLSSVAIPHFSKKYSTKSLSSMWALMKKPDPSKMAPLGANTRPHSTSSLEMQLRSGRRLMNDYQDAYGSFLDSKAEPVDQRAYDYKRRQFIAIEKQLWQLQRRYNIMNGTITNPRLGPYRDLLAHMELFCGDHNSDIIRFTTSRYGDLDLYTSIQRDKDHIISLFNGNSNADRHSFKNNRSRITDQETSDDNPR